MLSLEGDDIYFSRIYKKVQYFERGRVGVGEGMALDGKLSILYLNRIELKKNYKFNL